MVLRIFARGLHCANARVIDGLLVHSLVGMALGTRLPITYVISKRQGGWRLTRAWNLELFIYEPLDQERRNCHGE